MGFQEPLRVFFSVEQHVIELVYEIAFGTHECFTTTLRFSLRSVDYLWKHFAHFTITGIVSLSTYSTVILLRH
jgi:hypothetical protein